MDNKRNGNGVWNQENQSYEEFAADLKASVENLLGDSAQVALGTMEKVNCPNKKVLTILSSGDNTAPVVYLDAFYEDFKNGTDLDRIAGRIVTLCNLKVGKWSLTKYVSCT